MSTAAAIAHPNIAFIKYWGNQDDRLRVPSNGSISMNLGGLSSRTQLTFDHELKSDQLLLNGVIADAASQERAATFMDTVRKLSGLSDYSRIESVNNFPSGAGIASSASAYAALAVASACAAGLSLSERDLTRLARLGSGSACRSVPVGFVEWIPGTGDSDSYAVSIAPADHWDLVDLVAIVDQTHKATGSSQGHRIAATSPLQNARIQDAPRRLDLCRAAILNRDFSALAEISELDSNLMHAVMATSSPRLIYYSPATIALMHSVAAWRKSGRPVFYTIDAGPNVHIITISSYFAAVKNDVSNIPGVIQVLESGVGGGASKHDLLGEEILDSNRL